MTTVKEEIHSLEQETPSTKATFKYQIGLLDETMVEKSHIVSDLCTKKNLCFTVYMHYSGTVSHARSLVTLIIIKQTSQDIKTSGRKKTITLNNLLVFMH